MLQALFGILFFALIGLLLVWLATFIQRGRTPWAKRGFKFRQVRWASGIAAMLTFVLMGVVAEYLPAPADLQAGKPAAVVTAAPDSPGEAPAAPATVDAEAEVPTYTHLKGGYVACISKDLFDQFVHNEAVDKNPQADQYLLNNGCSITAANIRVSIIDSSIFGGWVEFRAYTAEGQPFNAWTNFENVVAVAGTQ